MHKDKQPEKDMPLNNIHVSSTMWYDTKNGGIDMNAPDKIYVNFPFGEEHPWHGPMVTKQGLNRRDTTYIRKDALLEWMDKNIKQLNVLYGEIFIARVKDTLKLL